MGNLKNISGAKNDVRPVDCFKSKAAAVAAVSKN